MHHKVHTLLTKTLGSNYNTTGDNYIYTCPNCKHHKKKLEINIKTGYWNCWVCSHGGVTFYSLFKWVHRPVGELTSIIGKVKLGNRDLIDLDDDGVRELPSEFIPLWELNTTNFYWRACINYLRSRDIYMDDIIKYGLGYCVSGQYSCMVIIPSYDNIGILNYFVSRAFLPDPPVTFKNPPHSRDIVGFDLMIDWTEPIILVESAFDAIAIRRNVIPLFGKTIPRALRLKMIHMNISDVIICLDGDAIDDAINHVSFFLENGINVNIVELLDGDDPSSLGYDIIWDMINLQSKKFDKNTLLQRIMQNNIYGSNKIHLPYKRHSLSFVSASQRISGSF